MIGDNIYTQDLNPPPSDNTIPEKEQIGVWGHANRDKAITGR